jgi:hypothetical protein
MLQESESSCDVLNLSSNSFVQIVQLMAEYLFDQSETWIRKWGEVFWRRMCDAYLRLHATPYLRAHIRDDGACAAKAGAAAGLEAFAESLEVVEGQCMCACVGAQGGT